MRFDLSAVLINNKSQVSEPDLNKEGDEQQIKL